MRRHSMLSEFLRSHLMDDSALQTVFRSVVIVKLQYASSAWWRFTTAAERHRIDAFIRAHSRFVSPDSKHSAAQPTINCLQLTKNYTNSCRYHCTSRKTTISAYAGITLNFRIASVILLTVTSLRECCSLTFISI